MEIKINTHGNPLPESHGEWVDLAAAEDVELGFLDFKIISLGVSMELPKGYYEERQKRISGSFLYQRRFGAGGGAERFDAGGSAGHGGSGRADGDAEQCAAVCVQHHQ